MDETAIAFELPHARASATHVGVPLDRISVRDYTRQVEIGAFQTERGVTQRIRFNVVLEVSPQVAARDDDVDTVLSYDTITEAIDDELAAERINLLETLAERIAARLLTDARVARAFVRIEKLDRIPGALGIEIVRQRAPAAVTRLHPVADAAPRMVLRPRLLLLAEPYTAAWGDALAARPAVLCLPPASPAPLPETEAQRRIGLLAIDQAAWALADRDPRLNVAASRTELDWALKAGRIPVWAPAHMLAAALNPPEAGAADPVALAGWLARELGGTLVIAEGGRVDPHALTTLEEETSR